MIAFVNGGPIALEALEALARDHRVAAIARATPGPGGALGAWRESAKGLARRLGLRSRDPIADWARRAATPLIAVRHGNDVEAARRLGRIGADIACIATFPFRLSPTLLAVAPHALNAHPSLLPRHRGADPLFWTFHAGDATGGVTAHLATDRLDGGDIVAAQPFPIARGASVVAVHGRCATVGAALLSDAVAAVVSGQARPIAQDDSAVTRAPRVQRGLRMGDYDRWDAEHTWHFLAGLVARYQDTVKDQSGSTIAYDSVAGFEQRNPRGAPGTATKEKSGWAIWCRDGAVFVSASSPALTR